MELDRSRLNIVKLRENAPNWMPQSSEIWEAVDLFAADTFRVRAPLTTELLRKGLRLQLPPTNEGGIPMTLEETNIDLTKNTLKLPITHHDAPPHDMNFFPSCCRIAEAVDETLLGIRFASKTDHGIRGLLDCEEMEETAVYKDKMDRLKARGFYGPYMMISTGMYWGMHKEEVEAAGISITETWELRGDNSYNILFQATPDVVRMVIAMRPTAIPWHGNRIKTMCCIVPQIRNFNGIIKSRCAF